MRAARVRSAPGARNQTGVGVVQGSVGKANETHLTPAVAHALDQCHNSVNGVTENLDGNRLQQQKMLALAMRLVQLG